MQRATILLAALLLAGAVSCSSNDKHEPSVTQASNTQPDSPTPSPTLSPSRETLNLGDTADIHADIEFSAAALAYQDKAVKGIPEMLSAGQKWAVLMVKVCNKDTEPIETTTYVWSLAYDDGARVESAGMNAGELPQPLYPMDAKVSGGDCVRGNIAFQVPEEGRPERVLYSPDGLDEPVEWLVGK